MRVGGWGVRGETVSSQVEAIAGDEGVKASRAVTELSVGAWLCHVTAVGLESGIKLSIPAKAIAKSLVDISAGDRVKLTFQNKSAGDIFLCCC